MEGIWDAHHAAKCRANRRPCHDRCVSDHHGKDCIYPSTLAPGRWATRRMRLSRGCLPPRRCPGGAPSLSRPDLCLGQWSYHFSTPKELYVCLDGPLASLTFPLTGSFGSGTQRHTAHRLLPQIATAQLTHTAAFSIKVRQPRGELDSFELRKTHIWSKFWQTVQWGTDSEEPKQHDQHCKLWATASHLNIFATNKSEYSVLWSA